MESPKGKFRMWQLFVTTVFMVAVVWFVNPPMVQGWGGQMVMKVAGAVFTSAVFYWTIRLFTHIRPHQIDKQKHPELFIGYNIIIVVMVGLIFAASALS